MTFILILIIAISAQAVKPLNACQTNAADLYETDPFQLSSHILDITRGVGAKNVKY